MERTLNTATHSLRRVGDTDFSSENPDIRITQPESTLQ